MTTEELIRNYEKGFARMITAARAVQPEYLSKILAVVYLDTLSKTHKPAEKLTARQRFVSFVRECSDWAECDYVSLAALATRTRQNTIHASSPTISTLLNPFNKWALGQLHPVKDVDVPLPHHVDGESEETASIVRASTHANLLYDLRNYLVHEARDPAFSFPVSIQEPHYIQYAAASFDEASWKLCYPLDFLFGLVEHSLTNLVELLEKESRDPYKSYASAEVWPS